MSFIIPSIWYGKLQLIHLSDITATCRTKCNQMQRAYHHLHLWHYGLPGQKVQHHFRPYETWEKLVLWRQRVVAGAAGCDERRQNCVRWLNHRPSPRGPVRTGQVYHGHQTLTSRGSKLDCGLEMNLVKIKEYVFTKWQRGMFKAKSKY